MADNLADDRIVQALAAARQPTLPVPRQVTGDPIVDQLIADREAGNQPLVEAKPYDLGAQVQSGWQAAKDLVDRYTQNMTEANRSAADLQQLALENMRSGSPGRMVLGAGQNILAPVAGVMAPLTGAIETARKDVEQGFGPGPANALEVAANVIGGPEDVVNAAKLATRATAKVAEHPELAMILGTRANLPEAKLAALEEAKALKEKLEAENIINPVTQRQAVTVKTGWSYDPQGAMGGLPAWKIELPDAGATFRPDVLKILESGKPVKLGDLLDHGDLYNAYPHLKDIDIYPEQSNARGSYFYGQNKMGIKTGQTPDMLMDTLLHETQHAIQEYEGFARGSSLNMMQHYNDLGKEFDRNNATLSFLDWARTNNKELKFSNIQEWRKEHPEFDQEWQKKWPSDYPTVRIKALDDKYGDNLDTIFQNIQKENQDLFDQSQGTMDALSAYYRVHGENEAHNVGERYRASLQNMRTPKGRGIYDFPFETSAKWNFDQTFRSPSDLLANAEASAVAPTHTLETLPTLTQSFNDVPPPNDYRASMIQTIDNSIAQSNGSTAKLPTALGVGSPYLIRSTQPVAEGAKPLFTLTTTNKNAPNQIAAIDTIKIKYPNMGLDPDQWQKAMTEAFASDVVPVPPFRFIKEINSNGYYNLLNTLTPGQIADADLGFQNGKAFLNAYTSGQMKVEDTGKLFLWGMLSRGVNPYTHEGLFLDAFDGIEPWIKMAAEGKFTKEVFETQYKPWAAGVALKGSGQPGAGAMHNLNAFGRDFLQKMGVPGEDGITPLQKMHNYFGNSNMSGRDIRREFVKFGEGVGIDNKVMSFILLATGRDDVMVIDRIQLKNLWDDGRYNDINIWDGIDVPSVKMPDKTVRRFSPTEEGRQQAKDFAKTNPDYEMVPTAVTGSSLAEITYGARGLLSYEAIEDALTQTLPALYGRLGRGNSASVGRFHWDTWVARSNQEASHGSLGAILTKAQGANDPLAGVYSRQGDYQSYAYGAKYGITPEGPRFELPLSTGEQVSLTPAQMMVLQEEIKKPKKGVVPKGFKVTESIGGPWYERPGVNRDKLDELIRAAAKYAQGGSVPPFVTGSISDGSRSFRGDYRSGGHEAITRADRKSGRPGISTYAEGGRTMGNNAIDNALRAARDHYGFGGADRDAAEGSSYTGNIARESSTPSFREAEDRSMREYNRAVESGWSPTGGGGGREQTSIPSPSFDATASALNAQQRMQPDVSPMGFGFGFGRRDAVFGQDFLGQAPRNISEWTQQRLGTVPENIYEAAKDPSLYYGMGYPGLVGKEPSRAGVAGLLGTLYGESTYNPAAINPESGAVGLAQYLGPRKQDFLRAMGVEAARPTDAQLTEALSGTAIPQMGYIINEMVTQPGYEPSSRQYLTGTNPSRVTDVLTRNFERPSEKEIAESAARRAAEARSIYAGETVPTAADLITGTPAAQATTVAMGHKGYEDLQPGFAVPESKQIPLTLNASLTPALNRARIAELEDQGRTELWRDYQPTDAEGNPISAKEWYRQDMERQLNRPVSIDEVKSGIVTRDGQQLVNYALKDPETEIFKALMPGAGAIGLLQKLFGDKTGDQQVSDALTVAREGSGGGDRSMMSRQTVSGPAAQAAPAPYLSELSESNLALPHPDGLTAQQWADANTGGDLSKVHARIKYVNGAPTIEYYTV